MAHNYGNPQSEEETKETKDFIEEALEKFKLAADAESKMREAGIGDLKFSLGDQWDSNTEKARLADNRPVLIINQITKFIRHVTNQQKQNRPGITVNPTTGGATSESAEILQGIIRNIENSSEAKTAYDHGFEMMARATYGYWRVVADYVDEGDNLDQELRIKRILNPFTVYFDPHCDEIDYSDADFAFVVEDMKKSDFKLQYPKADTANSSEEGLSSEGDTRAGWITEQTVRVAEYFYVEEENVTLYKLGNGDVQTEEPSEGLLVKLGLADSDVTEHTKIKRNVKWAKITAIEVLDKKDIAVKYIPIIPIVGDEYDVDGERRRIGMVTDAKDPQRMVNYQSSAAVEASALAPRAPFIVAWQQIEGFEKYWENLNTETRAYLVYNHVDTQTGTPLPPPTRNVAEPPIQAMMALLQQSRNDLMDVFGIYQPGLGDYGREESGKAILARQSQSDIANANYVEKFALAIRLTGKIILDWIPHIYDTPRVLKILKPDMTSDDAVIYKGSNQKEKAEEMKQTLSIGRALDVSAGKYDVTVSMGQSFQTRMKEASEAMLELMKVYPQAAPLIGDLFVKNLDIPEGKTISARLKATIPPEILGEEAEGDPKAEAQILKQQVNTLTQQLEQAGQMIQQANETINSKKLELDSKERIAAMQVNLKMLEIAADERMELMKQEGVGNLEVLKANMATGIESIRADVKMQIASLSKADETTSEVT